MQRLSRPPATPNVTLLDRRKPKPHPSSHANTTFTEQIYIRWCCIDLSNAPPLPDKSSSSTTCRCLCHELLHKVSDFPSTVAGALIPRLPDPFAMLVPITFAALRIREWGRTDPGGHRLSPRQSLNSSVSFRCRRKSSVKMEIKDFSCHFQFCHPGPRVGKNGNTIYVYFHFYRRKAAYWKDSPSTRSESLRRQPNSSSCNQPASSARLSFLP
jgi:hypothetical protein